MIGTHKLHEKSLMLVDWEYIYFMKIGQPKLPE